MAIGLTPAQRFHLDVYGYLLLEGILTQDEVAATKAALYRAFRDPDRDAARIYSHQRGDHYFHMGHIVEYDPALLAYAVHPNLIPKVEELVGGAVRLEESEAIINRRNPDLDLSAAKGCVPIGFHTGTRHGWGTYEEQNRFHSIFVKTLAYLTDVGPGDGGTAVIPGSHKMSWPQQEIIDAALSDPSLVRQIEAPAGSVILFPESLVHSTTEVLSDRERVVIVSGYTPTMMREWMGNEISQAFLDGLPEHIKPILSGSANWNWRRNYPV